MEDIWPALPLALTHDCRMAQCRDLENHHHEKLLEIAINTLEKILKGEMDEDLPDDVRAVSKGGRTGARRPGPGARSGSPKRDKLLEPLCLHLKETVACFAGLGLELQHWYSPKPHVWSSTTLPGFPPGQVVMNTGESSLGLHL